MLMARLPSSTITPHPLQVYAGTQELKPGVTRLYRTSWDASMFEDALRCYKFQDTSHCTVNLEGCDSRANDSGDGD
jgi:hypothetical protein